MSKASTSIYFLNSPSKALFSEKKKRFKVRPIRIFTSVYKEFEGIDCSIERGVPENAILIKNRSTNTGENILFTQQLLNEKGIDAHSFILVQKPYIERCSYATLKRNGLKKK